MIIEERVFQLLVPSAVTQLYPMLAPDGATPPYTTYLVMNALNLTTHSAPLPSTRMWNFQFSTYSPSYGEARSISNSISTALVGYTDEEIMGVTPIREHGSIDASFTRLYCWIVELQVTESLAPTVLA